MRPFLMLLLTFISLNAASVTLDKSSYKGGETINVMLKGVTGSSNNWVGIFAKEALNDWDSVLAENWFYFKNGKLKLKAPDRGGEYEVRLFYNDSLNMVEKASFHTDSQNDPLTISAQKTVFRSGEIIFVNYKNFPRGSNHWIGLFKKEDRSTWWNVIDGIWIADKIKSGEVYFDAPQESGKYEIRAFYHDSLKAEKSFAFSVVSNADKKIFIIGDSTVHNTTVKNGKRINYGWGDLLKEYMINPRNLYNLAQPGASSRSYKRRNPYENESWFHNWYQTKKIIEMSDLSNGGYLFIQFGHNDETDEYREDEYHTLPGVYESFYEELTEYIEYAKEHDLIPVLITPVERFLKRKYEPTQKSHIRETGDYAATIKKLAKNEDLLLLDLQFKSWSVYNAYEDTKDLIETFGYKYSDDVEHFGYKGAKKAAGWVKSLICRSGDKRLCSQFK